MEELTPSQEDFILEQGRENEREAKEGRAEVLFKEWLEYNVLQLQKEFLNNHDDEFNDFCKEAYKEECEELV